MDFCSLLIEVLKSMIRDTTGKPEKLKRGMTVAMKTLTQIQKIWKEGKGSQGKALMVHLQLNLREDRKVEKAVSTVNKNTYQNLRAVKIAIQFPRFITKI